MVGNILCFIYGAGNRGKKLASIFKSLGIFVEGFIDRDSSKWGIIEGIKCMALESVEYMNNSVIVFISPEQEDGIEEELRGKVSFIFGKKVVDFFLRAPESVGYEEFFPLGHYYSLYPDLLEVFKYEDLAWSNKEQGLQAIDLNEEGQYTQLKKMIKNYCYLPQWGNIKENKESQYRYRYGNNSLSNADAIGLFSMIRIIHPNKIIEVGSGWTSAIMLDINEQIKEMKIKLEFIEPYPDRLLSIMKKSDDIKLFKTEVQNIPVEHFETLSSGDILFIDSSHVSKQKSDVNYLFFEVFPRLKSGVIIHLHDIFYPFEYPHSWLKRGMVWNELFLLRSFLQYNEKFEILYFQNYMEKKYKEFMEKIGHLMKKIYMEEVFG